MKPLPAFALALVPLALTPLWVGLLGAGWIDLGGGDKDVLLALPWAAGSLVFAVCAGALIRRGWPLRRWLWCSTGITLGVLSIGWLVLFAASYRA